MLEVLAVLTVVLIVAFMLWMSKDGKIDVTLRAVANHKHDCGERVGCHTTLGCGLCTRIYQCKCGWEIELTSDAPIWLDDRYCGLGGPGLGL